MRLIHRLWATLVMPILNEERGQEMKRSRIDRSSVPLFHSRVLSGYHASLLLRSDRILSTLTLTLNML
jgi:hypothetical protein